MEWYSGDFQSTMSFLHGQQFQVGEDGLRWHGHRSLVTMVERRSRCPLIGLSESKEAVEVGGVILGSMREVKDIALILTYDNGKEFALHKLIGELLEADCYLAPPYHFWERGLNEKANGLIRQYFPKVCDLETFSPAQVAAAQDNLNSRPRKCLDNQTPNDIFHAPLPIALADRIRLEIMCRRTYNAVIYAF
jgi:IS30 family transposase